MPPRAQMTGTAVIGAACYSSPSTPDASFAVLPLRITEDAMTSRIFFFFISLLAALRLEATMVRVVGVTDGRTLVVEQAGIPMEVTLAGIDLLDDDAAHAMLQWTLVSRWVMLDRQEDGGFYVYRSPDALFVNRELVARGFARPTLPSIEPVQHVVVTYLGTVGADSSGVQRRTAALREGSAKTRGAGGIGSGTTRSSPATPSRPRRRPKP